MSRIRSIKPEILEDEAAASLSSDAWRLWVSMWVMADDVGRLRAADKFLKAKVFWGRSDVDCHAALAELVAAGFVHLYKVDGQWFAEVRNFRKHQRIEKPQPPKYPGPDKAEEVATIEERGEMSFVTAEVLPEHSGNAPGTLPESSPTVPGTFPVGREGIGRDQGSDGTRAGAREPESDVGLIQVVPGNATNDESVPREQDYQRAYEQGVARGKGGAYAMPGQQRGELHQAILAHGRGGKTGKALRGDRLLEWIGDLAEDFARFVAEHPDGRAVGWYSGYGPKGWLKYLNEQATRRAEREVG